MIAADTRDASGVTGTSVDTLDSAFLSVCRLVRAHLHAACVTIAAGARQVRDGTHDGTAHTLASCKLTDASGAVVGALCVIDHTPRTLNDAQLTFLRDAASLAQHAIAREEESELKTLALTGSGTGVWDRNVVTGEIRYSPAWHAIIGYEPHELSGRIEDAVQRLHPDDREYVKAAMQSHFDGETESYAVEHRIRCKDGRYKWICSRGKVVSRDRGGRALRMVGTTTDITALRELAQQLQHSIDLVTNLTHQVPGLVFQMHQTPDGQCRFSYASDGIAEIYELTPDALRHDARVVDALIDPRDLGAYYASQRESAANLTPWRLEYRVILPRQGLRWREGGARPQRAADGSTVWHGFITDVTERKRIEAELQSLATTDHLTQLSNRRDFVSQSEAVLNDLRKGMSATAATLLLDLDHFKALNDRWGHSLGDRVLVHFAGLLRGEAGSDAITARIGGEEFAVLLPDTGIDAAEELAQRIRQRAIDTPLMHGTERLAVTVSIGIDSMLATDAEAAQTLTRADIALYRAKEHGRNRIELYRSASRSDIGVTDMQDAVRNGLAVLTALGEPLDGLEDPHAHAEHEKDEQHPHDRARVFDF
jgi:diguanylate cyclase (GGDEF)-like protein/PAS domain S-box-containing protein